MAIVTALGAVVNWMIVLAHSKRTLELFELLKADCKVSEARGTTLELLAGAREVSEMLESDW